MQARVMVLGATGMAGHIIKRSLRSEGYKVLGTSRAFSEDLDFDAYDVAAYDKFFDAVDVDVVVNCIGALLETSSKTPHLAYVANTVLPKYLETRYKNTTTKIIHISTDCVFSGERGQYRDVDSPDERGVYGRSKACGELNNAKDLTIRTSIIGPELVSRGSARSGLLNWFLNLKSGSTVSGYSRCFWTGISTLELSRVVQWAIKSDAVGLVQVSRPAPISKYELLRLFNSVFASNISVSESPEKLSDKSLVPSEGAYHILTDYSTMVQELQWYIEANKDIYKY